ncbi:hypothetical protein, partial [Campylobacter vulpis]|uniref:hypothetical protein n=1 Tax=Campylobacter vulpis TaxID=1655500 RepID=UPI001BCF3F2C
GIVVESGTLSGGNKYEGNPLHVALANKGVINGDIEIKQGATLNGGVINWDEQLNGQNGKISGAIKVEGMIDGVIGTYGGTIGSIEIQENANVSGGIHVTTSNRRGAGTINGDIIVKGTLNGGIHN